MIDWKNNKKLLSRMLQAISANVKKKARTPLEKESERCKVNLKQYIVLCPRKGKAVADI